jgi:2-polyprenyl-3-methyl-5-hydroxy-6-metoxy-1,4-benzoquinol methylase
VTATRYSYQVDLSNLNTSHSLAVLSVPPGSRVLDLGAADGSVARALVQRHCRVWGVERDPEAAAHAATVCEKVTCADLESDEAWRDLAGERFDAVLLLDVLEHLLMPAEVLRRASNLLTPTGVVIVSLPNVTHAAVRLALVQGRFEYTEAGILDRTHLRFFDRSSAEQLFADVGLTITERLRVVRGVDQTEVRVDVAAVDPELLSTITAAPDGLTYQFVFVARANGVSVAPPADGMLAERLQLELETLRTRFAEVEGYARNLAAAHDDLTARLARFEELERELGIRMEEAQTRQLAMRHATADIAVKQAFVDELQKRLQTTADELQATSDELKALQEQHETVQSALRAYTAYVNSPSIRFAEAVIGGLRRIPILSSAARAVARAAARRQPR